VRGGTTGSAPWGRRGEPAEALKWTSGLVTVGPSRSGGPPFRLQYLEPYAEAACTWPHAEAEVVYTTHLTRAQAAQQIAEAVKS